MKLEELNPPIIEIPSHQTWYRIQRKTARSNSVRLKGYLLAPSGALAGRFDLDDEPTAYLGDSPETVLYESLFRREVRSCSLDMLKERVLVSFETQARVRLADLRNLPERYPVLQSMRYQTTQSFASDCQHENLNGILYASAQHPHHECVCLFKSGIEKTKKSSSVLLVESGTGQLHKAVINAAHGSQIPVTP